MIKLIRFWIIRDGMDTQVRMFWHTLQPVALTETDDSIIRDMGAIGTVDQERYTQFCETQDRSYVEGTLAHLWRVRKADMGRVQRDALVSILHNKLASVGLYEGSEEVVKVDLSGHIGGFGNEPVE